MPALAIDTATEVLALALGDEEHVIAESGTEAGRSHLEMLLPSAQELLSSAGMAITDMEAVVVGRGPGTFSGLRVGIATARALVQSLEIPLYGYSTLEAMAQEIAAGVESRKASWILPMIDARRGQVFTQLFRKEGENGLKTESGVLSLDPDRLSEVLPGKSAEVRAGGNGSIAYREILEDNRQLALLSLDDPANRVRASWHLGALRSAVLYQPGQLLSVLPSYVREPDADKSALQKKREPWLK
ncbi:MAG: tRNA (adenosine(37)-N6)-threonylcarbamoyltransferase complex dimerization subunit type 1 TsaB [Thermoleophilia bacterium]|nr:tRNA (adenosine(37)-N6)-threonylcarbamoyltransferase complex dimerization subunit type 1 TsaB [Thermoleophilia bacterium]